MSESVRLDKWLWAARFFKTRSAATEAVNGGKISVNDHSAKPARAISVGDSIEIRLAPFTWTVAVTGLGDRRGSAESAAMLYTETAESLAAREHHAQQLRAAPQPGAGSGRPSKRDRRVIDRWKRGPG